MITKPKYVYENKSDCLIADFLVSGEVYCEVNNKYDLSFKDKLEFDKYLKIKKYEHIGYE